MVSKIKKSTLSLIQPYNTYGWYDSGLIQVTR